MIVPLKGMTRYQGEPTHATLRVEYLSRLEDGQGNASPGVLDFYAAPADLAAGIWRDEHNRASEAALIVNDLGVRGTPLRFTETFFYADQVTVENTYLRNSTPTNLDGTEYDYTEAQAVQLVGPSGVPLTWQAAQEFISSGGAVLTDIETNLSALDTVLADIEQTAALATAAAGLTPMDNLVAINASPAGFYRDMSSGKIYEKGSGPAVERPDLTPPTRDAVQAAQATAARVSRQFEVPDTPALAATNPADINLLIVQHPERGGILTRSTDQATPANKITRFNVGGVFFSRSTPPREWRVDQMDIAGDFGGDVAAALNHLTQFQRDGDRLIFLPKKYRALTPWRQGVPVVFEGAGATIEAMHNGIGADLYPEGTFELAGLGARYFSGDMYGGGIPYSGVLPRIERTFQANGPTTETKWALDSSSGVRVTNHYFSRLDFSQGVIGFSTGLSLYADRKNLGIRDVGTSYCAFFLGRMENYRNIVIAFAANGPLGTDTPNHYVTENTLYGGSLSTGLHWDEAIDWAASTHIEVNGGDKAGMCDNTLFLRPSLEGFQRVGVNYQGHVAGFSVQKGRMEMPSVVTAVSYGPDAIACETEVTGLANNSGAPTYPDAAQGVIDLGRWNKVKSTDFPRGEMVRQEGKWALRGKTYGTDTGLRDWEPHKLSEEPVLAVFQPVATVTSSLLDPQVFRRISLTIQPGGGNGQDAPNAAPIYNNLISLDLARAPTFDGWEYEIELIQAAYITTIGVAWMPDFIKYGTFPQPIPRYLGRDTYLIRVRDGLHYVAGHVST